MKKYLSLTVFSALFLVALVTSGCAKPSPAGLSDQQVTSLTENVLKAIDADDYQGFIKDFSDQMVSVFTPEQFANVQAMLEEASGKYVSIGAPTLSNNKGYALYRFPCKYENETVYVTISMLVGGEKLEGLWVDSVNLRKASQ
jgi:hypothetical protein